VLVSIQWLRDFVDLPTDLDARDLAERFTVTTAEVEGVAHIACDVAGLIAAAVTSIEPLADRPGLSAVTVDTGAGTLASVTRAEGLAVGDRVVYAPPGARVGAMGEVGIVEAAGRTSEGMIVPGDGLGLASIGQRAVRLPPGVQPGEPIDPSLFNDSIVEIDNKSITNRPDLWGHYGIARELAAIYKVPLKSYPVADRDVLTDPSLPEIPIIIDEPAKCPRYSALRMSGVRAQPAPLWMQVRLAHVGLRPIDLLVDLTNYIMVELGQPMHAFDAANVDRIEVADARPGEAFTTLDGMKRTMPAGALMIQSNRRSVALAGIMGGAETEVTDKTESLLLESANFEPATIRRCATALGHRTDASARFEKCLDPNHTVLGIARFVHLARPELPTLKLTSRLSDCFPNPPAPTLVRVDPKRVAQYVGRPVPAETIRELLEPLEFQVAPAGGALDVTVPSFRATKDVTIEVDVIEEIARLIGYNAIEPVPPEITVRYAEPAEITQLEKQTLSILCGGLSYAEIHRHIWFDSDWLKRLGFEPSATVTLRNPSAAGTAQLRTTLLPGMLAAVDLNRHHLDRFELLEIGGAFFAADDAADDHEQRRLALAIVAPGRKAVHEDEALRRMKCDLETWARQTLDAPVRYLPTKPAFVWEHEVKTAEVVVGQQKAGRVTVVPVSLKRRIDAHLAAWTIILVEIDLSTLVDGQPEPRKLAPVPVFPQIEIDFSVLADARQRYADLSRQLADYDHELLNRLWFVDAYEGGSVPAGQRSLTFRARIGHPARTLTEADIQAFREDFLRFLENLDLTLRS